LIIAELGAKNLQDLVNVVTNVPMVDYVKDKVVSHVHSDVSPGLAKVLD
jgi:hypothetical protein